MKYLIINADDFGMSQVFNEVILDLIRKDLIKSTTVMVDRFTDNQKTQINELVSLSKNKNLSLGLHLDFKDLNYSAQIESQYQKFKEIFGFNPSHIDIHKPHSFKDFFPDLIEFCQKNNLPLRNIAAFPQVIKTTSAKAFSGSVNDFEEIENWLETFEEEKFYEIFFHPGKFDPNCKSSLNKERERDFEYIKKLNRILETNNIKMISYLDLKKADF